VEGLGTEILGEIVLAVAHLLAEVAVVQVLLEVMHKEHHRQQLLQVLVV
jgi:hypothetical protein